MTVKSPVEGVVYYGKCVRESSAIHQPGRKPPPQRLHPVQSGVMTVVQPRPMFIRTAVPEEQLHYLRPGLKGVARRRLSDLRLATAIDRVDDVPTAPAASTRGFR